MIKDFQPNRPLEPTVPNRVQLGPAIGAGVLTGVILLIVPRGSPWSSMTFFSPAILGRNVSAIMQPAAAWAIHLAVSLLYGLLISRIVASLRIERAILTGGLTGLVLYVINFGVISTWWPDLRGNEWPVVFTHIVFGLIAAGAYRGLLKRRLTPVPAAP